MPARPVTARDGTPAVLHVQLPADLKNSVVEAAAAAGMSVTGWVANALRSAARHGLGLPDPPPASHPLPTPAEVVSSYVTGERLLGPCGRGWPCDAAGDVEELGGVTWCRCGIRVS